MRVFFVRETEERTACPITQGSNNTPFHISLIFLLYFQPVSEIFSLFDALSHLSNLRKRCLRRVTILQGTCFAHSTKLRSFPCFAMRIPTAQNLWRYECALVHTCIEKHGGFALIVSSVCRKMARAHQRARGPHLFFNSL